MTLEQDILRVLTQAKVEIQANMQAKGINASGRTSRSFAVEQDAQGMRLVLRHDEVATIECKPRGFGSVMVGTAPLSTLEIGREGGKVPRGFYYMIKQWTRDKGLSFSSESERQTFSYFAARKIAREGTGRHKKHEDVYSAPTRKAIKEINSTIHNYMVGAISAKIQETAKLNK